MKFKLICFDMDGVIYSSEKILGKAYSIAIEKFAVNSSADIKIPSTEEILAQVGRPVIQIFANLFPELNQEDRQVLSDMCLDELCILIENKEGELIEDIIETLKKLKATGIIITLASNGRRKYLESILNSFDLTGFFDSRHFISEKGIGSKGGLIKFYMEEFNVSNESTLMVGDRFSDYEAAEQANTPFAAFMQGHGNDFENLEPEYKMQKISELIDIAV